MKNQMGLSWKKMDHAKAYVNTWKNIELRKLFALRLIETMRHDKILINFDESVIHQSVMRTFSWQRKSQPARRVFGKDISGLSILLAVTSDGFSVHQFLDGNNNEVSVSSFIVGLVRELDRARPGWRKKSVLLLDNCASHKTAMTRRLLTKLKVPTLFSAPASYTVCPVERFFGAMKRLDFDRRELLAEPFAD